MAGKKRERKGYEVCSGCGVCLLSCPVWRRTGSMSLTRKARAKALQGGATYEEISHSIDSCLLCGACEAVCPEGISLADLNMRQRQELNRTRTEYPDWYPVVGDIGGGKSANPKADTLFLAGESFCADDAMIGALMKRLSGTALASDDGKDISKLLEAGLPVADERIARFIASLGSARTLVVAEGLLQGPLREWVPSKKIMGLGEALLSRGGIRGLLGPEDLYVIESRGFHSDHGRLVLFYDNLRRETGCFTNLDLQRTAFSTGASSLRGRKDIFGAGCVENAKLLLSGKKVKRIVVEDLADVAVFRHAADIPVVHAGLLS